MDGFQDGILLSRDLLIPDSKPDKKLLLWKRKQQLGQWNRVQTGLEIVWSGSVRLTRSSGEKLCVLCSALFSCGQNL